MVRKKLSVIVAIVVIMVFSGCTENAPQQPPQYASPSSSTSDGHADGTGGGGGGRESRPEPQEPETSTVTVSPRTSKTSVYQGFLVDVVCEPVRPVKGWELTLSYDPQMLRAVEITQGDFFSGFATFPSPNPIIDNENGTVARLYGFIVGKGNVSAAGTLATVQFTACLTGTSPICISMVGLANETQYIPVTAVNGSIRILP